MSSVARLSFYRFCLALCGKNEKISIFDANLTAFRWWLASFRRKRHKKCTQNMNFLIKLRLLPPSYDLNVSVSLCSDNRLGD
jgi:hypothetical protein